MSAHTRLVTKIVDNANDLPDTKAIKLKASVYLEVGTPDLMICHHGRLFMVEAKTGDAKRRKIQERRAVEWSSAGAEVIEARSWQDVADALLGASTGLQVPLPEDASRYPLMGDPDIPDAHADYAISERIPD